MTIAAQQPNIFKLIFFSSLIFAVITLCMQILVTNKFAVKGNELSQLTSEKLELEKEVSKLELERASQSSLSILETRARSLGFVEITEHASLIKPATVASLTQF